MLSLIWSYFKKVPYYVFGVALVAFVWRVFQSYLKSRSVKKSHNQAKSDLQELTEATSDAESSWVREGQKTDKSLTDN